MALGTGGSCFQPPGISLKCSSLCGCRSKCLASFSWSDDILRSEAGVPRADLGPAVLFPWCPDSFTWVISWCPLRRRVEFDFLLGSIPSRFVGLVAGLSIWRDVMLILGWCLPWGAILAVIFLKRFQMIVGELGSWHELGVRAGIEFENLEEAEVVLLSFLLGGRV